MSAAAALLAVNEDERQMEHNRTEIDAFARNIEDRVSNLMGGISSWFSGVNNQTQNAMLQAQAHVEQQEGIAQMARKQMEKLESQLQAPSDTALQKSRVSAEPVGDESLFELDDESTPNTSRSADTSAADRAPPSGLWDLLHKVSAHPHVEKLQSAWSTANQDTKLQWTQTLKEAENLARGYVQSGGTAVQHAGRDLQTKLQTLMKNIPTDTKSDAPEGARPFKSSHAVQDEEYIGWDDDDELDEPSTAATTRQAKLAQEEALSETTSAASPAKPTTLAASSSAERSAQPLTTTTSESDADSDWE